MELGVFLGVGLVPAIDGELLAAGFAIDEVEEEVVAIAFECRRGGKAPLDTEWHYLDGGVDIGSFVHIAAGVLKWTDGVKGNRCNRNVQVLFLPKRKRKHCFSPSGHKRQHIVSGGMLYFLSRADLWDDK